MTDPIASILKSWGEPAYRLKQVDDARRAGARDWDEVTTLPKDLRARLAEVAPLWTVTPDAVAESRDGTIKWRLRTADGLAIDGEIECPKHGSCFSLRTGDVDTLPATRPVAVHGVRIDGADVYVEVG